MNNVTVFSVTQLNHQIKYSIESSFKNISVNGEISEMTQHSSGHMYFSIKDENSTLRCAMFNYKSKLDSLLLKIGDNVIISGNSFLINFYIS